MLHVYKYVYVYVNAAVQECWRFLKKIAILNEIQEPNWSFKVTLLARSGRHLLGKYWKLPL